MKTYTVKKIKQTEGLLLSDEMWTNAIELEDFCQPWETERPQKTKFLALYNADYLFLRYDVADDSIHVYESKGDKTDVLQSDRVELFLAKDRALTSYYALEIDSKGRLFDNAGSFYRQFDNDWTWPQGHIHTTGKIKKTGYQMNVAISMASIKSLGLLTQNTLIAGVYRADCRAIAKKKTGDVATFRWITWVNPEVGAPDFHIPSSFGTFYLEPSRGSNLSSTKIS